MSRPSLPIWQLHGRSPGAAAAARASAVVCAVVLAACGGQAVGTSAALPVARSAASSLPAIAASGDWTRFDFDARRSGVGPAQTGIDAGNLGALRTRTVQLDGTVDSSPIELQGIRIHRRLHDVIVVTTSYGRTIAVDAGSGNRLWEFTPPDIGNYSGTQQVTTATPVADPDRRYVYAASPDGRIRKLVLATGHEVRSGHWPVLLTFDATKEKLAGALNLSDGSVVAVTGGYYGDAPPYQGHVVMIDRTSGHISHVWNSLCSNRHRLIVPSTCGASDAAIWARAGAVIEPGHGRILLATGNGDFNGSTSWGDSVLELSPDAARLLHNWTPPNQAQLSASDSDVGSTAPALLPATGGRRLAVQGGKDGLLALLDLARLDGTTRGAGPRTGGELQQIAAPGGSAVLTAPAVWTERGRTYVFVANDAGTTAYVLGAGRRPRLSVAWQRGTSGTSPVVAGGLLYVYDQSSGQLVVREPRNGSVLRSLAAAAGHWNSPIVLGGRIVLPTGSYSDHASSGMLYIYHLPGR